MLVWTLAWHFDLYINIYIWVDVTTSKPLIRTAFRKLVLRSQIHLTHSFHLEQSSKWLLSSLLHLLSDDHRWSAFEMKALWAPKADFAYRLLFRHYSVSDHLYDFSKRPKAQFPRLKFGMPLLPLRLCHASKGSFPLKSLTPQVTSASYTRNFIRVPISRQFSSHPSLKMSTGMHWSCQPSNFSYG